MNRILILVLIYYLVGCASNKPDECDWYCPDDGVVPIDCYCKEEILAYPLKKP